jgi:arylsulfatase A-like enzyme
MVSFFTELKRRNVFSIGLACAIVLMIGCEQQEQIVEPIAPVAVQEERPNILLIMADDMGYTDLGSFGSQIRTPHLDALALGGVRLTNYHVGPACSQTRSMLMSGTYTEVGTVATAPRTRHLADNVVALPQLMKDAGYHTYMSGKWHIGSNEEESPAAAGFESSFALMSGAAEHFKVGEMPEGRYRENGKSVDIDDDFYSTNVYTDKILEYLKANEGDGTPFFAWYTPTTPHWPMQVPDDYLHRYDGVYDKGYDDLIRKRVQRANEMGVLPPGFSLKDYPRSEQPGWDELTEEGRRLEARKMELYAAMIENFDHHVGRIIRYLRETDQFDNTLIVFSSDNGGDYSVRPVREQHDNRLENLGRATSYVAIGAWGDAITAPFKWNKGTQVEGGTRVPAFIHHQSLTNKSGVNNRFLTVMDLTPTFLELAGSKHPGTEYQGRTIIPSRGRSFVDLLHSEEQPGHHVDEDVWYSLAFYRDEWKLVRVVPERGTGEWELYNVQDDPSETTNVAENHPELFTELIAAWTRHGEEAGAVIDEAND